MLKSILVRGRVALLSVAVVLSTSCSGDLTEPASPLDAAPAFAVASVAPIEALEGTPVQFYCGQTTDPEGDPLLCQWDFGNDGSFDAQCTTIDAVCRWDFDHDGAWDGSRVGSFDYTWPDQMTSQVRLDVSDMHGEHTATSTPVTVLDVAPTFWGREPLLLAVGDTQRFNTKFFDPGADGTWNFIFDMGDGTVMTGRTNPGVGFGRFHAYSAPGLYNVTVTITDKDGVSSSFTRVATVVAPHAPTANAGGPYVSNEGSMVAFSSAGSTDDMAPLTYSWDFGDGSRSAEANPTKLYRDNGTYTIRLIVTDPTELADTAWTTLTVNNVAPGGSARIPVAREGIGYTLRINGSDASSIDRATLQYSIDCGQGAGPTPWSTKTSLTCAPAPDQGTITATFSVRDKDGASYTFTENVTVQNAPPTLSLNAVGPVIIPVGGTINVEGRFNDAGAADGPFTYRITWNDGGSNTGTTPGTMVTTPLTASHTYTRAGTFRVFLFVTDKDGSTSRSAPVTVTVTP